MSDEHREMTRENRTVEAMISIFCHGQHSNNGEGLCPECGELLDYARMRLEKCPFQENKPTCAKCPVHCYKPDMKEKIRVVMKYAGPRMLYKHPALMGAYYIDGKSN
ncbi:MAG: nitrous oxide-stimulated promoter family protein [Proteobacteria bacterium]|nr:nitrous oxide-stimulated promoter family protein [Pseudomonadota bacterium]